ncbi:NB-ARC and TPR domain protein [Nemania abortiva]|nr:NB-ARC and TPR domain protein [Nemania abortiva]
MQWNKIDEEFSEQWKASITACCESLERNDLRRVSSIQSLSDTRTHFPKTHDSSLHPIALQEFAVLSRALAALQAFTDFVSNEASPEVDASIIWGAIGLVVKISQDEENMATRIPRMLRTVCHRIEILNKFWDSKSTVSVQTKEACFQIALLLLPFLFAIINFIRIDAEYPVSGRSTWQPLEKQFESIVSEIDETVSRLERLFTIAERSSASDPVETERLRLQFAASKISSRLPVKEKATLPCVIFPTSRTYRFFDRTDVTTQIDKFFQAQTIGSSQSFQSLALYGLGGVGKSSVALKYAQTRLQRADIDAVFWVPSEKEVSIKQSFTDIVMRLKLSDRRAEDHDENRTLVLSWLQHTRCRWLIIYDNVEDLDLLLQYWPSANQGQALITSRNRNFAFEPADGGLEIATWDTETGSQFLLHLLSTGISASLTSEEVMSAHDLSLALSGHALAISHSAGLIHRRSWSISEFLEVYKKMPNRLHGTGSSSINTLWDISFKSLNEQSRAILGIMSFLAPDTIPQALFEIKEEADLPESIKFCADAFSFSEEIENLLTLALIKRDKEKRAFSIHRLVQTSFKHFMTIEQRQQMFNDATVLVAHAFPRKDSDSAQLYQKWKSCSLYLPQVLSLRDSFREELNENPKFSVLSLYCELNNACQRYLLEINSYNDNLALFEVNELALKTITVQSHSVRVDLEGGLASHKGQVLARIGLVNEAVNCLQLSYDMFATDEPYDPRESAWCAENLANAIATRNDFPEAVKWQERAREHWLDYSREHSADTTEWPAILKKSMGTTLLWAGQRDRARRILDEGIKQIESAHPYNWAMAAYTHYELGTLDRYDRNYDSAESHYMEAQNKWLTGDNLRSDPFNGACSYRMGCVALDQGKVEAAIKHLRDSMVVTERHKSKMVAEHARTLFKLAEALAQEPRGGQESSMLRDEADRLLLSRDPKCKETGVEKAYDDLVCILWR